MGAGGEKGREREIAIFEGLISLEFLFSFPDVESKIDS
jgi:hypothetical protein